jgi:IclR family transcriptional regulator, KDG regulon repressor
MAAHDQTESRGPTYQVRALDRALDILDSFSLAQPELTLTEIAAAVDLPLSTTKRLVSALEERGYLEHSPETEQYRIGIRAFEVGSIYIQSTSVEAEAHPTLEWLARGCQQTANLAVLDRGEVVHIAVVPPDRPIRYFATVGEREKVYCTGLGKVLISELPEDELQKIADREPFEARTRRTITTLDLLKIHLEQIRESGYAMDDEESTTGLRCIAAPIRNAKGEITAAVSISGPSFEFGEDTLPDLVTAVKQAAAEISSRLGYAIQPDAPEMDEAGNDKSAVNM